MTKVLDDALLDRAAREAERALAAGDQDTLAGRFAPRLPAEAAPAEAASRANPVVKARRADRR